MPRFFFLYLVGDQNRELSYQMQYFQTEEHLTSNTSIVKQKWSYSQAYSLLLRILYFSLGLFIVLPLTEK